jgi:protease secretion system outer membrane protein
MERTLAAHAPSVDLIASVSKNTSESVLYYNQKIDTASIGVSMIIPIYKGGHTSASSKQASLLLEQSRSELNALISSSILDLRKYFFAHETILARLYALKFSEIASLESIRASEIAIVNGTGSNFDLLITKQKLALLENQMNDVKYEFFSNYFKIHNVTGHLTASLLTSFDQCN